MIWQLTTPLDACSYLPEQVSCLDLRLAPQLDADTFDRWLQRGWRRHGMRFFRPSCPACRECRSLRVDVVRFRATASQRRTWRRNIDVRVDVGQPRLTAAHLQLFNAYHEDMHRRRGWPFHPTDERDYGSSFLAGEFAFAQEFRYWRHGQLIGVGLVDATQQSLSSAYFYHDPAWRPLGPGTFSLLAELDFALQRGLRYHHLGYRITGCPSMAYKARFRPHQLLQRFVDDDEQPVWYDPA